MREYDETTLKIAERVLKRSDEIIEQRKKQASESTFKESDDAVTQCETKYSKIRHFTYALPGICAAFALCFCILGLAKYAKELNKGDNDDYPVTTSVTTVTTASIATSTTDASVTTAAETSTSVKGTTAAVTETTVSTDTSDTKKTTDIEDEAVQEQPSEAPNEVREEPEKTTSQATTTKKIVTTTVTTTAAPAPVIVEPTLCGDVNGDGEIDIVDVVLLNRFINSGSTVEEFYKKNIAPKYTLSFEQFLANIDAYRPSEKREITSEDSEAISGYINGLYPSLPIYEL